MGLYEDLEKGLLEAIAMEKGEIPIVKKDNMPAPTYTAAEMERKLIDEIVQIRKKHSPSLKLFYSMVHALGYDLKLVKAQ